LPPAPMTDGQPRRPRQVRAGVPSTLDDITCRALGLGGREGAPYTSPRELAHALAAAIPPMPIPPAAAPHSRRETRPVPRRDENWAPAGRGASSQPGSAGGYGGPSRSDTGRSGTGRGGTGLGGTSRSRGRAAVVVAVAAVVLIGLSVAAFKVLHSPGGGHASGGQHTPPSGSSAQVVTLTPVAASGFDALRTQQQDSTDENSYLAKNLIDHNPAGWQTQQYYGSPNFGNLKSGSGLILDMGKPVKITSVAITFGSEPGANVELKIGNSEVRSPANEESMATVASATDVFGTQTFTIAKPVTGQYLVVWFTKLPPLAHARGKYMAEIFSIIIRGTA
jgi:hypothetical protein